MVGILLGIKNHWHILRVTMWVFRQKIFIKVPPLMSKSLRLDLKDEYITVILKETHGPIK